MAYGAAATPHVFLFDEKRALRYQGRLDNGHRDPGPASENNARDILDLLLAGKDVPPDQQTSRVFVCSTKWSWKRELALGKADEWDKLPVSVETADAEALKVLAANKTKKFRLINVWSTSCGPCVAEFPDLVKIYQQYQQRDFDFVTISTDPSDNNAEVQKFLAKQHSALAPNTTESLKTEVGREAKSTNNFHFQGDLDALADALDPEWQGPLPHTVLLAPGGKILFRHTGQVDPIQIRRAIVKQLRSNGSE
jgi:thiol-disulfide isomerase/thioredoxin